MIPAHTCCTRSPCSVLVPLRWPSVLMPQLCKWFLCCLNELMHLPLCVSLDVLHWFYLVVSLMWPSCQSCDHRETQPCVTLWDGHVWASHESVMCHSVIIMCNHDANQSVWPCEAVMCDHHMSQWCDRHHFSNISLHLCHFLILLLWMWNGPFVLEMCCSTPNAAGTATGDISPTTKDLLESTFPSQIYSQCTFKELFSY